jgi:O-acetyl-ADP-ribose deacetylase (regulator of RNase III)
MPEPGMRIPAANVGLATRAALRLAETQRFTSIALPGMGTGVGGVTHEEAAAQMIGEIRSHQAQSLRSIILVDVDPAMVQAWRDSLRDSIMANG